MYGIISNSARIKKGLCSNQMKENVKIQQLPVQYQELLAELTDKSCEIFGENLMGVYLHGSAAMGCFQAQKSDLDLLFIVKERITDSEKIEFMRHVVRLNEYAPEKGIEMSVVRAEYCNPFVYPTPYELHFSPDHLNRWMSDQKAYIERLQGTDKDLAAHVTITRAYGVVLYGAEISEMFAPIPKEHYMDSIWLDIQNASEDILENPVYIILNLCRVLAYQEESLILSKKEGGLWGVKHLGTPYAELVKEALSCYIEGMELTVDSALAIAFAEEMISKMKMNG